MKNIRNLIQRLVIGGVALAMVSTLAAQTASPGAAKVVRMKGSARYTTGGNNWQPLTIGAVLKPGAIIQTGLDRGTYVDLVLGDGEAPLPGSETPRSALNNSTFATPPNLSYQPKADQNVVRMWANTVLGIDKLTTLDTGADVVTETQLDLKAGRIIGSVKKMSAASKYEVKLPKGVAGIRGTWFDLTAEGHLKVLDGSVVLAHVKDDGTILTQVVNSNQQFDCSTGQLSPLAVSDIRFIEEMGSTMRVAMGGQGRGHAYGPDKTIHFVSDNRGRRSGNPPQPPQ